MKSISIIIPTLFQANEEWEVYLDIVLKNIAAQEEIIKEYFKEYSIEIIPWKLVNEAWNEWVEKSSDSDIVMIINDDIVIEEDVWRVISKLEEWEVWCPYFSRKNDFNHVYDYNWDNIAWFCFALHTNDWKPIPDDLKIWYWDNYIYEYMWHKIYWGWNIHHWESKTLLSKEHRERINELIEQDKINWKKYARG